MQFTERKGIQLYGDSNTDSIWGSIKLKHLANPETMKITLCGETIIPESFNVYGEPIFSKEMAMLYHWKQEQIRRNPKTTDFCLEAEISYEEQEFTIPRKMFDVVRGIEISLRSLSAFKEMLNNRRLWHKATGNYLNEFVVFGRYKLDIFGQVLELKDVHFIGKTYIPDVCELRYFDLIADSYSATYSIYVPEEDTSCPCCGKKFTIEDLRNTAFGLTNGKISHDSCRKNYYHNEEIDKMTRNLVDLVYEEKPKFDLVSNTYNNFEAHIPWFLFHTPDGDILIGSRGGDIFIEWQENFKPFDMSIFNDEEVKKWCSSGDIYNPVEEGTTPNNGKRGIHAPSIQKAYEYLKKVKKL